MTSDPRTTDAGRLARERDDGRQPEEGLRAAEESRSVWNAVTRVADVGQRLLLDRLELIRLETREDMLSLSRGVLFALGAIPILLIGWISMMAGLVILLDALLPIAVTLLILGAIHVVVGGLGTFVCLSRLKSQSQKEEDELRSPPESRFGGSAEGGAPMGERAGG